jgi:hypothetical protein
MVGSRWTDDIGADVLYIYAHEDVASDHQVGMSDGARS